MDTILSPREKRRRDAARSFARARLAGRGDGLEARGPECERRIRVAAAAGLCGLAAPAGRGGAKRTAIEIVVTLEEIAAVSPRLGLGLADHNFLCLGYVLAEGTPAQREGAGRRLASGRGWGTCLDPAVAAGAAPGAGAPEARREGSGWTILDLRPPAREFPSETMIVLAAAAANAGLAGLTAFLWNRRKIPAPNRRTGCLRLPAEARLGEEGAAAAAVRALLERAGLFYDAAFTGVGANAYRHCLALAGRRRLFSSTLFEPAAVMTRLADAFVDLEVARLMVRRAAWQADAGCLDPAEREAANAAARAAALELLDIGLGLNPADPGWRELRSRLAGACPGASGGAAAASPRRACSDAT